jgi:excisionase family DNA binding protein
MEEWLSTSQTAKLLNVSKRTVLRWIARGYLPARRLVSGRLRIRRADAEGMLVPLGGPKREEDEAADNML